MSLNYLPLVPTFIFETSVHEEWVDVPEFGSLLKMGWAVRNM